MANMTLVISKELKKEMDQYPEINWSAVVITAFQRKIKELKETEKNLTKIHREE